MEKDKEPPFPREPWQRLLQDRANGPPETTDARIRAKAQKAVASRAARWWLPASLAASVLIAALIVQSQYGKDAKPPVVTESDLAVPATSAPAPASTREPAGLARERAVDSAAAARKQAATSESLDEAAPEEFAPAPPARVGGPEQELKAANEMDAEDIERPLPAPEPAIAPDEAPARSISSEVNSPQAAAMPRTPGAWYADIEALRKAGRNAEADAELARFEAAYPDWIKEHDRRKP